MTTLSRDDSPLSMFPIGERFTLNGLRIREADEKECEHWGWDSVEACIKDSIAKADSSYVILWENKPLVIWGYATRAAITDQCYAWMFSFPAVDAHPIAFARGTQRFLEYLLDTYRSVIAFVEADHEVSVKWLKWLGFRIIDSANSPLGKLYYIVERRR